MVATENPLWWRAVTSPLWQTMKHSIPYPLEGPALKEQERVTTVNKKLHEAARKLEIILIPLAIAALAIVGWVNRDQIASTLDLDQKPIPALIVPPPTESKPTPSRTPRNTETPLASITAPKPLFSATPDGKLTITQPATATKELPTSTKKAVAPTPQPPTPKDTEIPVDPGALDVWKSQIDGSGGTYIVSETTDWCPEWPGLVMNPQDKTPKSITKIVCYKNPDGTLDAKQIFYVNPTPTP